MEINEQSGYSEEFYKVQDEIRRYSKFIAVLVRLELVPVRHAQILASNFSQDLFNKIRSEFYGPIL